MNDDPATLSPDQWQQLKAQAATYQAHQAIQTEPVAGLGAELLDQMQTEHLDALSQRCQEDAALAPLFQRLKDLEKIALLQRDLLRFARSLSR